MDLDGRNCLMCTNTLEFRTDDISIAIDNNKILFDSCIRFLKIEKEYDSSYKWKWDAPFDSPNFCSACGENITLLSVYDENQRIIKGEIDKMLGKVKSVILNSISDEKRNFHPSVPDFFSAEDISSSAKIQYYRSNAVRDWNPVVTLTRFDVADISESKNVFSQLRLKEETDKFLIYNGEKCFTVVKHRNPVKTMNGQTGIFQCKNCQIKPSTKCDCRSIYKKQRKTESITPQSIAKFYSKSEYVRDIDEDKLALVNENEIDTRFIKPLVIKCEPVEEIRCLICYNYFGDGGTEISSELFASISFSLKVNQWKLWEESSNSPVNVPMLCSLCLHFVTDLHLAKLELDETEKNFQKLLLQIKADLILTIPVNRFQNVVADSCQSVDKLISEKEEYFRRLAVKELTPIVRLFKTNVKGKGLHPSQVRSIHKNSIFKLVKTEEIVSLHPGNEDGITKLTVDEFNLNFQYDGDKYLCKICSRIFQTYDSAVSHCNKIHVQIKRFECTYCSVQFYNRHDCAYHIVSSHKYERVDIAAEIEKSIAKSQSVQMTSEDGVIELPNKCIPKKLVSEGIMKVGNKFKCTICSKIYQNRSAARKHQIVVHLNIDRYKCEFCDYKHHDRFPVLVHLKNVHPEKLGNQSIHPKRKKRQSKQTVNVSLMRYVEVLKSNVAQKIEDYLSVVQSGYACTFCGRQFIGRLQIIHHLERVHFAIRNFQCKICGRKYHNVTLVKKHLTLKHFNIEKDADVNSVQTVDEDKYEHLEAEKGNSVVTHCNISPKIEENLVGVCLNNFLPFEPEIEDPLLCGNNGSSDYANQSESINIASTKCSDLVLSENTEDLSKVEDIRLDNKQSLVYKHIQPGNIIALPKSPNYEEEYKKGFNETVRGYECTKCDKIFKKNTIFRQHWGIVHDKSGGYACSICQKRFYAKFQCAKHYLQEHSNIRPFVCTICDVELSCNAVLQKHVKNHFDERPFACSECPLKFTSEKIMQKHYERIHMRILGT